MQAWHLWAIAGIVLIIIEMLTPAFFFASFSAAALLTAAATAAGLNLTGQLAVFAGVSVVCIFAVRPLFSGWIYRHSDSPVSNTHALIGQTGIVVDEIENAQLPGRVKIGSEEWRAVSHGGARLLPGERVEIVSVASATLTVRPQPQTAAYFSTSAL